MQAQIEYAVRTPGYTRAREIHESLRTDGTQNLFLTLKSFYLNLLIDAAHPEFKKFPRAVFTHKEKKGGARQTRNISHTFLKCAGAQKFRRQDSTGISQPRSIR